MATYLFFLTAVQAYCGATVLGAIVTPNIADKLCYSPSIIVGGVEIEQTCIKHGGLTRCFYTYIPESAKSSVPANFKENENVSAASASATVTAVPLVLDLHGYNLCAAYSANYTGWSRIAEEYGFIVVWPQGNTNAAASNQPCWSFGDCCCSIGDFPSEETGRGEGEFTRPPNAAIDDIGFLRQIIANLATGNGFVGYKIDTRRLYFAGHSNGCMMAHAVAALSGDLVAAVCCHASGLMVDPPPDVRATPVHVVYGDLDYSLDLFLGGPESILEEWGEINDCMTNVSTEVDESQLYATHTRYNCSEGATVQTVELFNTGHFPYLGFSPNNSLSIGSYPGAVTPTVDTTLLSWQFCSKFTLTETPDLPEPVGTVQPDTFVSKGSNAVVADAPGQDGFEHTSSCKKRNLFHAYVSAILTSFCMMQLL